MSMDCFPLNIFSSYGVDDSYFNVPFLDRAFALPV